MQITKQHARITRLAPAKRRAPRKRPPDFMAMLNAIYGKKVLTTSGAELVAKQRGCY